MPCVVGLATEVQAFPFQCRRSPPLPSIHPSVAEVISTAASHAVVGLVMVCQADPFQRKIMPFSPTATPSLEAIMSTSESSPAAGFGAWVHAVPFQCQVIASICPAEYLVPTAQPSFAEIMASAFMFAVVGVDLGGRRIIKKKTINHAFPTAHA